MLGVRNRPKGARFAFFGLGLCVFALTPTEIGYQDIASLLARQPGVAERWQKRVFSAVGTIQVATYSFGRPIGTSSPQAAPISSPASTIQGIDITGSMTRNPLMQTPPRYQASDFPKVDRTLKGDRLVAAPPPEADRAGRRRAGRTKIPRPRMRRWGRQDRRGCADRANARRSIRNLQAALSAPPLPQYDVSMSLEAQPLDDLKVGADADSAFRSSRRRRTTAFR